ncbi:hypothetical protein ACJX0J_042287 [Zea mays]
MTYTELKLQKKNEIGLFFLFLFISLFHNKKVFEEYIDNSKKLGSGHLSFKEVNHRLSKSLEKILPGKALFLWKSGLSICGYNRTAIHPAGIVGFFCAEKERAVQSFKLAFEIDQDNAAGLTLQIKAGDWDSIAVFLYVYGYNYLRSQCAYDSLPKRIILESRLFSGDNKFMFTYTTQFQILFKASFLFSNLKNHIFIYLLTLEIYLLTLD